MPISESAFPCPGDDHHDGTSGVTLRDYFAAHAKDDDIYTPDLVPELTGLPLNSTMRPLERARKLALVVAKLKYIMADAMIEARKS